MGTDRTHSRIAAHATLGLLLIGVTSAAGAFQKEDVTAIAPDVSATDDWPAFRGKNRDGVSRETNWMATWPDQGLRKVWETRLANDFGSLSIQDGRIYTIGTQTKTTKAYCLDATTGKVLWEHPISELIDPTGAGSTPTVSGSCVVAVGADGTIVCLNKSNGTLVWDVPMNLKPAQYCYSSSPLIHKDMVIVFGGPAIRAFALATGNPRWKTDWQIPGDGGRWSSPVLGTFDGQDTVVCLSRSNLIGLDPDDGTTRWTFPLEAEPRGEDLVNTPVIVGNRIAFLAFRAEAARKTRIVCVEVKNGVLTECWKSKDKIGNRTQSLVAWDDCLYLTSAYIPTGHPATTLEERIGAVHCFDLQTGDVLWTSSAPQLQAPSAAGAKLQNISDGGAFMIAGGKLLLLSSAGCLTVSDVSAKGCTVLSHADVLADLKAADPWGHWEFVIPPLLLNGRLYLRNHERLVCYDVHK